MSLTVSLDILKATQSNQLKRYRDQHITPARPVLIMRSLLTPS
ncbi:hypothetical protein ACTG16_23145 [Aeromonas sp. 23P]